MSSVVLAERRELRRWQVLARAVAWDLRLQVRYQIVTVSVAISLGYAILFRVAPAARTEELAALLVFSDPTTIGFLFVGVLVLFERQSGTLQAVAVSPLSPGQYLWSKAISLTLVALLCAGLVAVAAHGWQVRVLPLVAGVALTSLLLVFIGFVAVARVQSVNQYLLVVPLYLVPATVPLAALAGLELPLFYAFPTYGSLLLIEGGFAPLGAGQAVYALLILGSATVVAFWWARNSFQRYVRGQGSTR